MPVDVVTGTVLLFVVMLSVVLLTIGISFHDIGDP